MSADMRKMASAFNTTVLALEDELMQLILDGQIQARIDSHNKILYAKDVDQRSTTFEKSLLIGKYYQRRTRMLILRAAMLKHQIHIRVGMLVSVVVFEKFNSKNIHLLFFFLNFRVRRGIALKAGTCRLPRGIAP